MPETVFIINFNNKFRKTYDDDRFRIDLTEDGIYRVYSRIHKNVVIEFPKESLAYIQYGVKKRDGSTRPVSDEVKEPENTTTEVNVEEESDD